MRRFEEAITACTDAAVGTPQRRRPHAAAAGMGPASRSPVITTGPPQRPGAPYDELSRGADHDDLEVTG